MGVIKKCAALLTIAGSLFVFPYTASAAGGAVGFVGGSLGVDTAASRNNSMSVTTNGVLFGATGKYFMPGRNFGLGITYFNARHNDDEDREGTFETTIKGTTFDVMFNDSNNFNEVIYLVFSYGKLTEDLEGDTKGVKVDQSNESDLYGFGIGSFSVDPNELSIGAEIKYMVAAESTNAGGLFQIYLSLGQTF